MKNTIKKKISVNPNTLQETMHETWKRLQHNKAADMINKKLRFIKT